MTGLNNAGFPINGDYADSFLKIAIDPATTAFTQNRTTGSATRDRQQRRLGIKVVDYFTPLNQTYLNATDKDVGSSAVVVVPDYNPSGGPTSSPPPRFPICSSVPARKASFT